VTQGGEVPGAGEILGHDRPERGQEIVVLLVVEDFQGKTCDDLRQTAHDGRAPCPQGFPVELPEGPQQVCWVAAP